LSVHQTPSGDPAALLARLTATAVRHHSPCGDGEMVWRQWGEGPALVLLHGGYGSWSHWLKNIEALARHYRVIAADMPGLGDSAMPPGPITPEGLAAIIDRGLDTVLAPGERFHLVGFSFGAMLGSFVARRRRHAVRSLVLVGSASMGLRRAPMHEMEPMRRHMTDREVLALQRANLAVLMFADEHRIDDIAVRLQVENVARARVKSRRFAPVDLLRPVLPQVAAPLGGIWGERDATAYPYVEERRDLLRAIQPNAPFDIIAGAGHWVMYEAPDAFNHTLLAQLAATERAATARA